MPVNLSIKAVPDHLVEQLRERANKNHRSLQGELMTLLENSLSRKKPLSAEEAIKELKSLNFKTKSESTKIIRKDRDER